MRMPSLNRTVRHRNSSLFAMLRRVVSSEADWISLSAVLVVSTGLLYGSTIEQTVGRAVSSLDWLYSFVLTLVLSAVFVVQSIPLLRMAPYSGESSRIGSSMLGLSLFTLFASSSSGPPLAWLSLIGFACAFLVSSLGLFSLRILWPLLVPTCTVVLPRPTLDIGGTPIISYFGIALLVGVTLFRSALMRRLLGLERRREPCFYCGGDPGPKSQLCFLCGKITLLKSRTSLFAKTLRATPYLVIASTVFLLSVLDSRVFGNSLANTLRFYSNLLVSSLIDSRDILLASTGVAIILATASYARRVDGFLDGFADLLLSHPELLMTFDAFRRARSVTGITCGERAYSISRRLLPGESVGQFSVATARLREIGALGPAYTIRDGLIVRVWKVKSP